MNQWWKRMRMWGFIIFGVLLYWEYGDVQTPHLSHTQIKQRESNTRLESIARKVKAYMKEHDGQKPINLTCILNPDEKTVDVQMIFRAPGHPVPVSERVITNDLSILEKYADYVLPTNTITDILVHEKPGLWDDGTVAVYLLNRYGSWRVKHEMFLRLLVLRYDDYFQETVLKKKLKNYDNGSSNSRTDASASRDKGVFSK